jgi:tol-pal system protein YbgF
VKGLKGVNLILIILLILGIWGCVPESQEVQNLKIKLANLELLVQEQNQQIKKFQKELAQLRKKIKTLEKGTIEKATLSIKTGILADIEELKNEQAQLSSQFEELHFKFEEKEKELAANFQKLHVEIQALKLKLKELENKLNPGQSEQMGESTSSEEFTNNTTIERIPGNETSANQTITNKTQEVIFSGNESGENVTEKVIKTEKEEAKIKEEEIPLNEAELYQEAYTSYRKGDYIRARRLFEEYVARFPEGKWIGQAYYWIGETYFKTKDYEEAILAYQKLIDLPGWHPQKPSAMLKQAQAFLAIGDKEAAQIILKRLIKDYPNTPQAVEARNLLSR